MVKCISELKKIESNIKNLRAENPELAHILLVMTSALLKLIMSMLDVIDRLPFLQERIIGILTVLNIFCLLDLLIIYFVPVLLRLLLSDSSPIAPPSIPPIIAPIKPAIRKPIIAPSIIPDNAPAPEVCLFSALLLETSVFKILSPISFK